MRPSSKRGCEIHFPWWTGSDTTQRRSPRNCDRSEICDRSVLWSSRPDTTQRALPQTSDKNVVCERSALWTSRSDTTQRRSPQNCDRNEICDRSVLWNSGSATAQPVSQPARDKNDVWNSWLKSTSWLWDTRRTGMKEIPCTPACLDPCVAGYSRNETVDCVVAEPYWREDGFDSRRRSTDGLDESRWSLRDDMDSSRSRRVNDPSLSPLTTFRPSPPQSARIPHIESEEHHNNVEGTSREAQKEFWIQKVQRAKWMGVDHCNEAVPAIVREAPDWLKIDGEFIMEAVMKNGDALKFADKSLQANKNIVKAAIQTNGSALKYAHNNFKADEEMLPMALRGLNIKMLGTETVREMVLLAVQADGLLLELGDDLLRADPAIVSAAVKSNGAALELAHNSLKADQAIVFAALKNLGIRVYGRESTRGMFLTAVQCDGLLLRLVPETLKADAELVIAAVVSNGHAIRYASQELLSHEGVIAAATDRGNVGELVHHGPETVRKNRAFMLKAIESDSSLLKLADAGLRADRDIVLAAVRQQGKLLLFADAHLQEDVDVVSMAIKQDPDAFKFAHANLRASREIVLLAVKGRGRLLRHADKRCWADRELVMLALAEDGMLLKFASAELQADREVVQQALHKNPNALKYADESLRNDRTMVLGAVRKHGMALKYAGNALQSDYDVVITAGRQDNDAFKYAKDNLKRDRQVERHRWIGKLEQAPDVVKFVEKAPDRIKADRNFMVAAVKRDHAALEYADEGLAGDQELEAMKCLETLSKLDRHEDILSLVQRAPPHLRASLDFMRLAVRKDGMLLKYADESLKGDRDLLLEAMKRIGFRSISDVGLVGNETYREMMLKVVLTNGMLLELSDEPTKSDRDVVFRAIRSNPEAIRFASPDFRFNREAMLIAVRINGLVLRYAHEMLKNDREVVLQAVQQNPDALQFAAGQLRLNKDLVILAARYKPSSVKFAEGGLQRDADVQKAAGTWIEVEDPWWEEKPAKVPAILSLEESSKFCSDFKVALKKHWFLGETFSTMDPNTWEKHECGKSLCEGTPETCGDPSTLSNYQSEREKDGKVCWRLALSYEIFQCAKAGGAMFQVEQEGGLTPDQEIQVAMARTVRLKVFRARARRGQRCSIDSLWRLGCEVRKWHEATTRSTRMEIVNMD